MVQQPKKEVRDRFLKAASQLFETHGFAGTSLRAVVAVSGRSVGNLRNYFHTKDALFAAACEPVVSDVACALKHWSPHPIPQTRDALVRLEAEAIAAVVDYTSTLRWGFGKGCRHMVSLASPIAQLEFAA